MAIMDQMGDDANVWNNKPGTYQSENKASDGNDDNGRGGTKTLFTSKSKTKFYAAASRVYFENSVDAQTTS